MGKIKICDTHNDFLTELNSCQFKDYIDKCKKNNVEIICSSFWSSKKDEGKIEQELLEKRTILSKLNDNFLLHIEDLWWVKDDKKLNFLLKLNPFSCSLTWNYKNLLAGGVNSEGDLTPWGKKCIERLTNEGIVIDLAHLNRKSFYQVAKILKNNLYCSHTGFYGVKRDRRNLTDKQIEIINKSNGFIGLFFFDKCIQKNKNKDFCIKDIVEHIKYFTSHWGIDNIGIGSDFYGIENYPIDLKDYDDFKILSQVLLEEGFSQTQINKLFYENFKAFQMRLNNFN